MAAEPSASAPPRPSPCGTKRSFDVAFLVSSASEPASRCSPPPAKASSAFTRVWRPAPASPPVSAVLPAVSEEERTVPLQPRALLAAKLSLPPRLPLPFPLQTGLELLHKPLLPPLPAGALSAILPGQNVCALCRISFRMTSDLVYHMRSHHRRQEDGQRRAREEKLRCSVCGETFRERHHLTRHMTAHTERDGETR
ncbi:PR domain zinc finger protein 8 [Amphibalanus amphitrite]|uniref:PR domain zinc finger protein 8 n=1 Tax=Amphibalanus amphitrite TaxID=1232801 RepID=A0A6A4W0C3_AMPAM|nr:PR domain zinc finger protein 8 [Amphibalanus amphitrite]